MKTLFKKIIIILIVLIFRLLPLAIKNLFSYIQHLSSSGMETWYYGIESDFAQIKADQSQIIRGIAEKIGTFRKDAFFGVMIEPEIDSLEKKIEKPFIVQA